MKHQTKLIEMKNSIEILRKRQSEITDQVMALHGEFNDITKTIHKLERDEILSQQEAPRRSEAHQERRSTGVKRPNYGIRKYITKLMQMVTKYDARNPAQVFELVKKDFPEAELETVMQGLEAAETRGDIQKIEGPNRRNHRYFKKNVS